MTLDHVIFSACKLDYAVLSRVRVLGPVLFVRCSLREAEFQGCDLARAAFDGCELGLTVFGPGGYRGCDLRGNGTLAASDQNGSAYLWRRSQAGLLPDRGPARRDLGAGVSGTSRYSR